MQILSKGIAHVSFTGGGLFLPVRSPYDRQILLEHVTERARKKGLVQILLDEARWMVDGRKRASRTPCTSCGDTVHFACFSPSHNDAVYCLSCAFGVGLVAGRPHVRDEAA